MKDSFTPEAQRPRAARTHRGLSLSSLGLLTALARLACLQQACYSPAAAAHIRIDAAAEHVTFLRRRNVSATQLRPKQEFTKQLIPQPMPTAKVQIVPTQPPAANPQELEIRPQLFLLFLVMTKINNQAVWERWLQGGMYGYDYQALVHCKDPALCKDNIRSSQFEIIQSVDTLWCNDLVGGMNALLKAAVLRSGKGSPQDKFVFLSDSTLPVKPFQATWTRLTSNHASDFCVFPRNEWAQVSEGLPGSVAAKISVSVKHHQWIVLNKKHAEMSVAEIGKHMDLMNVLQLNRGFANTGCLDEFWHFSVAYPNLHLTTKPVKVQLEDFGGEELSLTNYEPQGRCTTFVHWVQRASGINNNITLLAKELAEDAGTTVAPPTDSHPASFSRLSSASLLAMRHSDFLFVRKVEEGTTFSGCEHLDEAFAALVFAPQPQALPDTAPNWGGDGVWLDNRRSSVAISSLHGAARLVGGDKEMRAEGHYCGNKLQVAFESGYQASAVLSLDGAALRWDNGVVWSRATRPAAALSAAANLRL